MTCLSLYLPMLPNCSVCGDASSLSHHQTATSCCCARCPSGTNTRERAPNHPVSLLSRDASTTGYCRQHNWLLSPVQLATTVPGPPTCIISYPTHQPIRPLRQNIVPGIHTSRDYTRRTDPFVATDQHRSSWTIYRCARSATFAINSHTASVELYLGPRVC